MAKTKRNLLLGALLSLQLATPVQASVKWDIERLTASVETWKAWNGWYGLWEPISRLLLSMKGPTTRVKERRAYLLRDLADIKGDVLGNTATRTDQVTYNKFVDSICFAYNDVVSSKTKIYLFDDHQREKDCADHKVDVKEPTVFDHDVFAKADKFEMFFKQNM